MLFCLFELRPLFRIGKADRNMGVESMRATSSGSGGNPYLYLLQISSCRQAFWPPHAFPKDRMRGNGLQLQQEGLRVEVRKNFGSVTTVYQAR